MADPFSDTHATIWTVLEASTAFTTAVPAANRYKLTGAKRGQLDDLPRDTQHPAVAVMFDNGRFDPDLNSSAAGMVVRWQIVFTHADERVTDQFLPLMWTILRALAEQHKSTSTLRTQTWNSKTYVRDCRLTGFNASYAFNGMLEDASPTKRWRGLWTYEVDMAFTSSDLPPS